MIWERWSGIIRKRINIYKNNVVVSTYISKDDSQAIKGIAILLMLYYHLFNRVTNGVADWWIGGEPLTKFLSHAAYPVPFFLMMSGYGLYYSYLKGQLSFKKNIKRAFKLYTHYWMVMLLFVTIGSFIASWHYPGTIKTVAENVVGIRCTYNYETWFLLPYVILSLLSPIIFRILDKVHVGWAIIGVFFISYGALFVTSRYVTTGVITNTIVVFSITLVSLLFEFVLGMSMARVANLHHLIDEGDKNDGPHISLFVGLVLLVSLIALKCLIRLPWDAFYAVFFVLIFINFRRVYWIDSVLCVLGKKSMVMWMVHTYFSIYLFHDFIYGFKYPIIIYIVLIVISYFVSVIISMMVKPIFTHFVDGYSK